MREELKGFYREELNKIDRLVARKKDLIMAQRYVKGLEKVIYDNEINGTDEDMTDNYFWLNIWKSEVGILLNVFAPTS